MTPTDETEDVDSASEEVEDSGPAAKRARGSSLSGWCLPSMDTDSHRRCPVTVNSFTCTCTCDQHGTRAGATPQWVTELRESDVYKPDVS